MLAKMELEVTFIRNYPAVMIHTPYVPHVRDSAARRVSMAWSGVPESDVESTIRMNDQPFNLMAVAVPIHHARETRGDTALP